MVRPSGYAPDWVSPMFPALPGAGTYKDILANGFNFQANRWAPRVSQDGRFNFDLTTNTSLNRAVNASTVLMELYSDRQNTLAYASAHGYQPIYENSQLGPWANEHIFGLNAATQHTPGFIAQPIPFLRTAVEGAWQHPLSTQPQVTTMTYGSLPTTNQTYYHQHLTQAGWQQVTHQPQVQASIPLLQQLTQPNLSNNVLAGSLFAQQNALGSLAPQLNEVHSTLGGIETYLAQAEQALGVQTGQGSLGMDLLGTEAEIWNLGQQVFSPEAMAQGELYADLKTKYLAAGMDGEQAAARAKLESQGIAAPQTAQAAIPIQQTASVNSPSITGVPQVQASIPIQPAAQGADLLANPQTTAMIQQLVAAILPQVMASMQGGSVPTQVPTQPVMTQPAANTNTASPFALPAPGDLSGLVPGFPAQAQQPATMQQPDPYMVYPPPVQQPDPQLQAQQLQQFIQLITMLILMFMQMSQQANQNGQSLSQALEQQYGHPAPVGQSTAQAALSSRSIQPTINQYFNPGAVTTHQNTQTINRGNSTSSTSAGMASPSNGTNLNDIINYDATAGQSFNATRERSYGTDFHNGVDFDSRVGLGGGDAVNVMFSGEVIDTRAWGNGYSDQLGNSNAVTIRSSLRSVGLKGNFEVDYGHVQSGAEYLKVKEGQVVQAGQELSTLSMKDSVSSGGHLDMKILLDDEAVVSLQRRFDIDPSMLRKHGDKTFIDPQTFMRLYSQLA